MVMVFWRDKINIANKLWWLNHKICKYLQYTLKHWFTFGKILFPFKGTFLLSNVDSRNPDLHWLTFLFCTRYRRWRKKNHLKSFNLVWKGKSKFCFTQNKHTECHSQIITSVPSVNEYCIWAINFLSYWESK